MFIYLALAENPELMDRAGGATAALSQAASAPTASIPSYLTPG